MLRAQPVRGKTSVDSTDGPPHDRRRTDPLQQSVDSLREKLTSLEKVIERVEKAVETLNVVIFGRFDEDTVRRKSGLYDQIQTLQIAVWVAAASLLIVALHTVGLPTELLWKVATSLWSHL